MIQWIFNLDNYSHDKAIESLPMESPETKDYKVRLVGIDVIAREGTYLLKMSLCPLKDEGVVFFRFLSLDGAHPERTDQELGAFYYSFGVPAGDQNFYDWKGKVGLIRVAQGEALSLTISFIPRRRPKKFDRIASAVFLKGGRRWKGNN